MKAGAKGAVLGLKRTAARRTCGAIAWMMPSHLPPTENSKLVNPVTFRPEEARFATIPIPTGSVTEAKMIGTVLVSFAQAVATGVVMARIRSGRLAAISVAAAVMR